MKEDFVIDPFSNEWWIYTIIVTTVIFLVLWISKRQSKKIQNYIGNALSGIAAFLIIIWQIHFVYTDTWSAAVSLPFHLCGISKVVGAIILIKFNQRWFEFILLLGMGGALQSIFTPFLEIPRSAFAITEYYFSHSMIIIMPLFLFYVKGHRLTKNAWLYGFLRGLVILAIVGLINYYVKGNYILLCEKPLADNPLLIGPWPYYLSGFIVFGFINIVLFHFLFNWWGKRLDAKEAIVTAKI